MEESRKTLEEKITQCYKSPFKEFLISSIKPAIGIHVSSEKPGFSKMGGIPWIKEGEAWPRSEKNAAPMFFLLQIDLKELKMHDLEKALPTKGILSFYFASDTWEGGIVKYYEETMNLVLADLPSEYFENQQRLQLPFWKKFFTKENSFQLFEERSLEFELEHQIPNYDAVQVELFEKRNAINIFDFQKDDHLIEQYFLNDDGFGKHYMLGYYTALQESKYELPRIEYDNWLRHSYSEQLLEEALEWRILLKLGSDRATKMNWVDAGNLFFFIRHEDLKNRRFDNIKAYLDTT